MNRMRRKKLYHQFCWFALAAQIFMFSGCGKPEHTASDALAVSLDQPPGEGELFWYGVSNRRLRVVREGQIKKEIAWANGETLDFDLKEGDELEFLATDGDGRLVISGRAPVGKEKKVSIPIRRVL